MNDTMLILRHIREVDDDPSFTSRSKKTSEGYAMISYAKNGSRYVFDSSGHVEYVKTESAAILRAAVLGKELYKFKSAEIDKNNTFVFISAKEAAKELQKL